MAVATEKEIFNAMRALDITYEEAVQMFEDDERINKGEKLFELTAEQQAESRKARKVTVVQPNGRKIDKEIKINPDRESIVQLLIETLTDRLNVKCERPEKATNQFTFNYKNENFKIVVSKIRGSNKK